MIPILCFDILYENKYLTKKMSGIKIYLIYLYDDKKNKLLKNDEDKKAL